MNIIEKTLSSIELGEAIKYENLAVFPLLAEENSESEYLTLYEAVNENKVKITEVSEQGTVPELLLSNSADKPVLLLDGEELIGAKQNRIVNLTILAPAKQSINIPVSCVEAGRWSHRSQEFSTSKRVHYSDGRAQKMGQVNESLRHFRRRASNQGEVWSNISEKAARMKSQSVTDAMADIFEQHESSLDNFCGAFATAPTQAGAIFAINGVLKGLELFDASSTCTKLMPKLIQSYALDAIDMDKIETTSVSDDAVTEFLLEAREVESELFPAIGLGEDVRLNGDRLCGGALTHNEKLVHFCLFRMANWGRRSRHESPIRRASVRSRNRNVH